LSITTAGAAVFQGFPDPPAAFLSFDSVEYRASAMR
jgi:hypothetical protein